MNIITPINQLGYGVAGLNILKGLDEKIKTSLFMIGQPQVTNQQDADIVSKCINNAHFFDPNAKCLRIWHQNDMSQFVGRNERIGFPFFELNKFSEIEKHHLNSVDRIFVASSWAKSICEDQLNLDADKINVIPLGVDDEIFKPCDISDSEKTIFFNCGKWEIRKGHDLIPELFLKAFDQEDDVELWMMNSNPFLNKEETEAWHKMYLNNKLANKIKLLPRVNTQQEVYNIMKEVDCGIFPSRAEGWNLELLELLACGKHVITTNYSAHTEYCNRSNSMLVDITNLSPAKDDKWFDGKIGEWADISFKQKNEFIQLLRNFYEQKKSGKLQTNEEGIKTSREFTWSHTSKKILHYV